MDKPHLSVVIPAYNESQRLKRTLPQIHNFFSKQKFSKEIIIVDDGSTDSTSDVVSDFVNNKKNYHLLKQSVNKGKGAALKAGIAKSKGDWVLFMDADLSTPLTELNTFWTHTDKYPIVIGSRKMNGAKITRRQSFLRESLGKVFTFLTNTLTTKGLSDITCGFKLFKGNIARSLFKKSRLPDWSFDAEILFLAQTKKYLIKEVPVTWKNDPRTKVSMIKDGINALAGLLKIRVNYLLNRY